jgi:hypothetical protein
MHIALVCRPEAQDVYSSPENEGYSFSEVLAALRSRTERGDSYEVIDTTNFSDSERGSAYIDRAVAAAGSRYRVGRVFGSNRHPGEDFGWRVPALLIYAERRDRYPTDVYPHEFKDGRVETIAAFLTSAQDGPLSSDALSQERR